MYKRVARVLDAAYKKITPASVRNALKLIENKSGYTQLQRRLEALLKEFDRLAKNYAIIVNNLKDDLATLEDLANQARRKCKDKECRKQITEIVASVRRLVGYWEGEQFGRLVIEYGRLKKTRIGKIPPEFRKKIKEVRGKFINNVERYALGRIEKILNKINAIKKYCEEKAQASGGGRGGRRR